MNIKYQPLLKKITEHCIKLRYRCNGFFTFKTCTLTILENHSIQHLCSKQLQSHVWTISLVMESLPIFLVQAQSYKRVFAFLFDELPVSQDTFARIFEFKIQLNFVKANFIKTNNSLRRSESSVPNRVLLILTKIQLFKSKYLCRTFYVSKHILRSRRGVFFIKSNG